MKIKDGVFTRVTVIKDGVETILLPSREIIAAWTISDEVSQKHTGKQITITSILDGKHKVNSKHYSGNAFDVRSFTYSKAEIMILLNEFKKALGKDYDVLFETDHFHIEYDPK